MIRLIVCLVVCISSSIYPYPLSSLFTPKTIEISPSIDEEVIGCDLVSCEISQQQQQQLSKIFFNTAADTSC